MTPLRKALVDYLAVRRALGFRLDRPEKLLGQFLTYLESLGEDRVRTKTALDWATLPTNAHRSWLSYRLSVVRGFAGHLRGIDPATEVPPTELLPWRRCRATPYLYSEREVADLMSAAETFSTPHRVATYQTLIGLLAVTGMRVGEALGLNREDLDTTNGALTVYKGKSGKSRQLPLHPSTVRALRCYLSRDDRPPSAAHTQALLVSIAGTRLLYHNVQTAFHQLVELAHLKPRADRCRPRLHDLRHTFAVCTVLDGYCDGEDPGARLPLLATYLGHVDPGKTYWYLSAAPELLGLAGNRLQRYLGGDA